MIHNPYDIPGANLWLRGNLHTHTTQSDGKQSLQSVIDRYHELQYDFLMISDHDIVTSETDYNDVNSHDLVLLPGNEISRNGNHTLHVDARSTVDPDPDRQRVIDAINADNGFSVMCHPMWWTQKNGEHTSHETLATLTDYVGIELYNGVVERINGCPDATSRWDPLLSGGRRIWGFANDDYHDLNESDAGRAWNVTRCADRSPQDVISALRRGAFYASTGVTIEDIGVHSNSLRIVTTNAERIVAIQQIGRRVATADGTEMTLAYPEDATYIRFECFGSHGVKAWSQPFFRTEA